GFRHLVREPAAVGIAENHPGGSPPHGGLQGLERVLPVREVPVEKVLRVVDHVHAVKAQERDALFDHPQVLVQGGPEGIRHVKRPGLAENGGHLGARPDQRLQVFVVLHGDVSPPGAAERRDFGVDELDVLDPLEELRVLGVGAGKAPFDEVDAELVEPDRDVYLIFYREGDAFSLGAVAQRRVVQLDLLPLLRSGTHRRLHPPLAARRPGRPRGRHPTSFLLPPGFASSRAFACRSWTRRFTAWRYARALARITSVLVPRPMYWLPLSRIRTTTSPRASLPEVTPWSE